MSHSQQFNLNPLLLLPKSPEASLLSQTPEEKDDSSRLLFCPYTHTELIQREKSLLTNHPGKGWN